MLEPVNDFEGLWAAYYNLGRLFEDQLYILAKQNRKLERLYGQVDLIITDCPILLSYYYDPNPIYLDLCREIRNKANQIDIFLRRVKSYNPKGRLQTEEEARKIDGDLLSLLGHLNIQFDVFDANDDGAALIHLMLKKEMWNNE